MAGGEGEGLTVGERGGSDQITEAGEGLRLTISRGSSARITRAGDGVRLAEGGELVGHHDGTGEGEQRGGGEERELIDIVGEGEGDQVEVYCDVEGAGERGGVEEACWLRLQ